MNKSNYFSSKSVFGQLISLIDDKKIKDPEAEKKIFKCVKRMKDIMAAYYLEAITAKENKKMVAWITSGGPVEPLIGMDVIPIYPENYGAIEKFLYRIFWLENMASLLWH